VGLQRDVDEGDDSIEEDQIRRGVLKVDNAA
jgi:hypothetical protein